MAHTYTRTVTVVPSSAEYSWTNPATGWITINQVGSSDTWEITVNDNQTNQARSATLTVNHADGTTTNSINVNQAAGNGSITITPSPTPVPSPTPTDGPSITTISLGPKGSSLCTATTTDTFNYTDNGIFQIGDSIPGAESDGQAVRVVTAATGSAAAQVGKVFAIQEDEIMGISDCTPVLQMTVEKGYTENNWGISSMSISSDSTGQVASTGFGLGVTGGPITGTAGDTVVIDVNMGPNGGREWQSAGIGGYVVPTVASGEVTSILGDDESHSAFFEGSTGMATYKFSFTFPSFSGNSANTTIQLEANTQETSNSGTISFGAVGVTECDAASTTDTYSYIDNGVFTVGDSISGALPNSQGSRQVTAATGSAAVQVGKVFGFMEDEIMGISDCVVATITLTNNGTSENPLNFSSAPVSRAITYTVGPGSGTAFVTNLPSWLNNNQTSSSSSSGTINLSANMSLINSESATITVTSSAGAVDYIYVYYNATIVEDDEDDGGDGIR